MSTRDPEGTVPPPPLCTYHCVLTCQAPQAPVAQARILLDLLQLLHVQAQLREEAAAIRPCAGSKDPPSLKGFPHLVGGLITGVLQGQVHHGVLQCPAHVEFQRQVVDPLPRDRQTGRGVRATPLAFRQEQLGLALSPTCLISVISSFLPAQSSYLFQTLGPNRKERCWSLYAFEMHFHLACFLF